ncbi:MAG: signal peptidase I [Sphingomicrobium sp.]|nr:signal peptidase I [Sphingomonadales bacterium]
MTAPASTVADRERGSTLGFFVRLALLAWVLRCLIIEPFFIPSGSMLPTMAIGDYLFVAKWPYGYSRYSFLWQFPPIRGRLFGRVPTRGDVIVFKPPTSESGSWVKRVIGVPSDRVEVRDGVLILNGKPVPKVSIGDYATPITPNSPCRMVGGLAPRLGAAAGGGQACLYPAFHETLPNGRSYTTLDQIDSPLADHFGPVTVPAGTVFVMGDNRDDSEDSRFSPAEGGVGFLPVDRIVGRASIAFWSTDGSASYVKPWTWFTAMRASRLGTTY